MKAPLHFKNFIKRLFCYENNELVVNKVYIKKVNAQNSRKMTDPILCYLSYTAVESFKVDYDRDIANIDYFDIIFEESSNANFVVNLNIVASFEMNHNRNYIIPIEHLKEYIQLNNIIKRPVEDKKVEVVKKDDRITSRYDIMEID